MAFDSGELAHPPGEAVPGGAAATRSGCATSASPSRENSRGRRIERFRAVELTDEEKPPILRAYLKRWKAEVGVFFGGVSANSPEDDVRRIAPDHPVFRIEPAL